MKVFTRIEAALGALLGHAKEAGTDEHTQPPRTTEQLLRDLRDQRKLMEAVLTLAPEADPAAIRRLLAGDGHRADARLGQELLWALQQVHGSGVVGRPAFIPEFSSYGIGEPLPYVEVSVWAPDCGNGQPTVAAEYRFAADFTPASWVTVQFTIGYNRTPDGSENLVYAIGRIAEEEAQDPEDEAEDPQET